MADKKEKVLTQVVGFEVKGEKLERKKQPCPKCGEGYWLADHKDRVHCGHCSYTRWKTPTQPEQAQAQPKGKKKQG